MNSSPAAEPSAKALKIGAVVVGVGRLGAWERLVSQKKERQGRQRVRDVHVTAGVGVAATEKGPVGGADDQFGALPQGCPRPTRRELREFEGEVPREGCEVAGETSRERSGQAAAGCGQGAMPKLEAWFCRVLLAQLRARYAPRVSRWAVWELSPGPRKADLGIW